jgi:hypothetical protein
MESETLVIDSTDFIKSIEVKQDKAVVGAYAIRFSGPNEKDLAGEYFTAKTYLGSHHGDGADVLFNHGFAPSNAFGEICGRVFAAAKATLDEVGVFVQHTLELSDEYEAAIAKLVGLGKLKWSSGTASHLARKSATGEIKRWPIAEFSYTPMPAEPRLPAISPLKSAVIDKKSAAEIAEIIGPRKVPEDEKPKPKDPPVDNPPKAEPLEQKIMEPEIQEKIDAEVKARVEKFQKFVLDRVNAHEMRALSLIAEPDKKTMKRRDFDSLTVGQRMEFLKSRGSITD